MPEINSATTRSINQITYTPIKIEDQKTLYQLKRAWEKWGFRTALNLNISELDMICQNIKDEKLLKVISTLKDSIPTLGTSSVLRSIKNFGDLEIDSMIEFGNRLISLRENIIQYISDLFDEYKSSVKLTKDYTINKDVDSCTELEKTVPQFGNGKIYPTTKEELIYENIEGDSNEKLEEIRKDNTKLSSLLEWYRGNSKTRIKSSSLYIENYLQGVITKDSDITVLDNYNYSIKLLDKTRNLLTAFQNRMVDPCVGYMNLERMTFTPLEAVRGDLLYTVPLAPLEEVNISHKQWSNTSEEFEKIVTDYLENYSEQGVTEKTDMSQSTNSQSQHASQFNLGVNASGGYGPININTSVAYGTNDMYNASEQFSRNQSINITRQASSRVKKENKVTFKVLSAYGNEDETVRKIKNPYNDRVIRIDYYNLMRKWQVKLYQYDVRMTYDITIPDPGSDILDKLIELDKLKNDLYKAQFKFPLFANMITEGNYINYMSVYGVSIEPPPPSKIYFHLTDTHVWDSNDKQSIYIGSIKFDVPNDYEVDDWELPMKRYVEWDIENRIGKIYYYSDESKELRGKSGSLSYEYMARDFRLIGVDLTIAASLKSEAFSRWQLKAWTAMKDAAQAQFEKENKEIKDRIDQLNDELSENDPLTLRKIEREEIMKGVLRWFFADINFKFFPEGLPEDTKDFYGGNKLLISEDVWNSVLLHEEMIKFLHHAIEWENMNYVLYPYFWSQPSQWDFKKFLEHPDFLHRAFLKAGAARVVLTIRPGFEQDFARFWETGSVNGDLQTSLYLTIAQELENMAKTNYPGIPPANPEEADRISTGKEIGSWYEYTPTSALDISLR